MEKYVVPKQYEKDLVQGLIDTRQLYLKGTTSWDIIAQIQESKTYENDKLVFYLTEEQGLFLAHISIGLLPIFENNKAMLEKFKEVYEYQRSIIERQNRIINSLESSVYRQNETLTKYEMMTGMA